MTQLTTPMETGLGPSLPATRIAGVRRWRRFAARRAPAVAGARQPLSRLVVHAVAAAGTGGLLVRSGTGLEPLAGALVASVWLVLLCTAGCLVVHPLPEPWRVRQARVVRAGAWLAVGCWFATTLTDAVVEGRALALATLALGGSALAVTGLLELVCQRPTCLAVVGSPADVGRALKELARSSRCHASVACLTVGSAADLPVDVPVHVGVGDAVDVAVEHGAQAVLVLPDSDLSPAVERRLEWRAAQRQIDVYLATSLLDVTPSRTSVLRAGGLDVLHVRPAPTSGPGRLVKDLLERAGAALALVLLLPALVVVGLVIRRDSPGRALFRQERVGRNGRIFTMYKFRTMSRTAATQVASLTDLNEADGVLFKVHDDPRVTKVGAVLRRWSVDELPQLLNVVRGDMSLVGPRPALPHEVARYDVDPRRRLCVKPGLTGLWQVSGRSDLSWEESVRLDLQYVDNWSLALDLAILCRTVQAVVSRRGAY